jgi:Flp pilus assembly secretin CpaC
VDPGTRFSLGNPEVIQVKSTQVSGGKSLLLVKGKSIGYSDLILLNSTGVQKTMAFRVVSKRQAALAKDGQYLLAAPEGIQLQANGEGWLARGTVSSLDDWNAVKALEQQAKGKVQLQAKLHPLQRAMAESRIRRLLRDADLGAIEVKSAGNTILIYGDAANAGEKELAESLSREVFQGTLSQIRVPFERGARLRFKARILEVLKSSVRGVGFQWQDQVPGALQVSSSAVNAGIALEAALRLLEKRGQARLLSQPELLLNEKGVAELKVGGEIPIQLQTRSFSAVQWKPYGLSLRLELPGVSRQLARARISVEISTLDPANGVEGVPAMRVSKMETEVDMDVGKAVLLSGLMENRESRNLSGLPFLGDIPIIGELFRSHDFQENRSELVILIEASR